MQLIVTQTTWKLPNLVNCIAFSCLSLVLSYTHSLPQNAITLIYIFKVNILTSIAVFNVVCKNTIITIIFLKIKKTAAFCTTYPLSLINTFHMILFQFQVNFHSTTYRPLNLQQNDKLLNNNNNCSSTDYFSYVYLNCSFI